MLVIVRHGESQWNLENRFTGEVDVVLTKRGKEEAKRAGLKLKDYHFNIAFTSALKRAQDTLAIILESIGQQQLRTIEDKALNERSYGDLQGLNKAETAEKFGEEQVMLWRRSYHIRPPGGESLEDTVKRVLPYYQQHIEPLLHAKQSVLLVAHGNSLRALMMYLEDINEVDISAINIPTGVPRVYSFNQDGKIRDAKYL